jgi:hypothetical protein
MEVKRRVNLCNSHEVYMLVLARKLSDPGPMAAPQQSDYAQDEWVHGPAAAAAHQGSSHRKSMVDTLVRLGLIDAMRGARERLRVWRASGMALPAPDYQPVKVRELIARSAA